ncbi:hypothetical protein BJF80_03340 [Serinicoccus sp. CUA-874]|uniref:GNAT family N-acetyltransferase n=1 Tax=Serinicoccus sp. CUA-874 TaxID=1517939 RepID=UPI00095C0E82|nr:GNAT family N-acetyltransferase [Serinicoccus sp. CUA-874]OLT17220.1 hypothetical protein BJF80_03340 [Serinicoccus sp. CUA-874]
MPLTSLVPDSWQKSWRKREVLDTYVFPVHGPGPAPDPARSLEDATEEVLDQMRRDYPDDLNERKHALLVERLSHPADRTLVIRDEHGEPCGYCHITTGDTENARIHLRLRVGRRQAYLWDDHVFIAHRRRGLHAFSIARRLELLAEDGRTQGVTMISRKNTASRASYGAFGARRTRQHVFLKDRQRTLTFPTWVEIPAR